MAGVAAVALAAGFQPLSPRSAAYESDYDRLPGVIGATFESSSAFAADRPSGNLTNLSTPDAWPIAGSATSAEPMQTSYAQPCPQTRRCWDAWELNACVRGYYLNDQRIQWTGNEETFGVEATIAPRMRHTFGKWETSVEGEFYLNQPFDRNVLIDTPEHVSYRANFEIPVLEIFQLFVSTSRNN